MSQQHMNYEDVNKEQSSSVYGSYEGFSQQDEHADRFSRQGQKLSATGSVPTATQRLILAIVSIILLMVMTFSMILLGYGLHVDNLGGVFFFILLMAFYSVVVLLNLIFNRKAHM